MVLLINCFGSILVWPYVTINYISSDSNTYAGVWISEFIFFVDFVLNFFLQNLNEDNKSQHKPLSVVATNYLYGGFTRDFVALLPLGELARINKNLEVLNVIKIIRIRILNYYLSNSFLMPLVNSCITSK